MKVVAAMDSMKGSLTSREAGNAAREGILRAIPDAVVTVHTVADGGEGTAEALVEAYGGRYITSALPALMGSRWMPSTDILRAGTWPFWRWRPRQASPYRTAGIRFALPATVSAS